MQFYYGDQMFLRLLDEAEFWKHQEEEHTIVIREIVPDLERKFVEELKESQTALRKTHHKVIRFIETVIRSGNNIISPDLSEKVLELINYCLQQSVRFVNLCYEMLQISVAVKQNPFAVNVIKHIIRESEYFIGIAQTISCQR